MFRKLSPCNGIIPRENIGGVKNSHDKTNILNTERVRKGSKDFLFDFAIRHTYINLSMDLVVGPF